MEHESETRFHELETKYINALEERDAALGQIHKIQTEKDNLASTIASYQSNAEELQIQIIEFKNQSSRTKVELQQFVQEKQDLVSIIEKRDAEISTIKGIFSFVSALIIFKRKEICLKKDLSNCREPTLSFKLNLMNLTVKLLP